MYRNKAVAEKVVDTALKCEQIQIVTRRRGSKTFVTHKENNMKGHRTSLTLLGTLGLLTLGGQMARSQEKSVPITVQVHLVITDAALRDDAELPRLQTEDV